MNIRVAVIEPNPIEREYLLALVSGAAGVTLTGAYEDPASALPEFSQNQPDIVITDLTGSDHQATAWLKQLHSSVPNTSVLVLSNDRGRDEIFEALEAGVSGWLQKPCAADQILRAIGILYEGGAILSSPVARKILEYFHARGDSVGGLSRREREILNLLGQGVQAVDIAHRLELSRATVRTHIRNLLQKLNANSRTQAVAKYLNPRA